MQAWKHIFDVNRDIVAKGAVLHTNDDDSRRDDDNVMMIVITMIKWRLAMT